MNTASLELSKALYELSGWDETFLKWYEFVGYDFDLYSEPLVSNKSNNYRQKEGTYISPAYDLGYLLRKLPQNSWVGYVDTSGRRDYALAKTYAWNEKGTDIDKIAECRADTPEDAACMLAIELFKQGAQPGQAPPQGGKQ